MIDFIAEKSSIAFETEYMAKALEIVPNALNLILTRTRPDSLFYIAVYWNQKDVDISIVSAEKFMAERKSSIKDPIQLHCLVSMNCAKV